MNSVLAIASLQSGSGFLKSQLYPSRPKLRPVAASVCAGLSKERCAVKEQVASPKKQYYVLSTDADTTQADIVDTAPATVTTKQRFKPAVSLSQSEQHVSFSVTHHDELGVDDGNALITKNDIPHDIVDATKKLESKPVREVPEVSEKQGIITRLRLPPRSEKKDIIAPASSESDRHLEKRIEELTEKIDMMTDRLNELTEVTTRLAMQKTVYHKDEPDSKNASHLSVHP